MFELVECRKKNTACNRRRMSVDTFFFFLGVVMKESAASRMVESVYQSKIIKKLEKEFPGCVIIKNNPNEIQGIPDLLILFRERWAMLEVKASEEAPSRPNQPYYVEYFDQMSYCSFVYPSNEEEVFRDLQHALCDRR